MKKWQLKNLGAVLECIDAAVPVPGAGELLIKVSAVSLNYKEKWILAGVSGMTLPFPFVPGSDMVGVVEGKGEKTKAFAIGDRVISVFEPDWLDGPWRGSARLDPVQCVGGFYQGVLAEYIVMPEEWLVKAPVALSDVEASTLTTAGLTAWSAVVRQGHVKAGEFVLVHGTGGVAMFATQIAHRLDAQVIVTSRGTGKFEKAKRAGATHTVDSSNNDWVQAVIDLTGGAGIDLVIETVGGSNLSASLETAASGGRICLVGGLAGYEFSLSSLLLMTKQVSIIGVNVGHRRSLIDLAAMIERTGLHPLIDSVYPFEALPAALEQLDKGPVGKIVVQVN